MDQVGPATHGSLIGGVLRPSGRHLHLQHDAAITEHQCIDFLEPGGEAVALQVDVALRCLERLRWIVQLELGQHASEGVDGLAEEPGENRTIEAGLVGVGRLSGLLEQVLSLDATEGVKSVVGATQISRQVPQRRVLVRRQLRVVAGVIRSGIHAARQAYAWSFPVLAGVTPDPAAAPLRPAASCCAAGGRGASPSPPARSRPDPAGGAR